ncbi:MAG TPA: hypothetical protein VK922_05065, partial [Gemmatimonadaceae bacterium]|nr:hypothetical protein [Gemmatimonadaceae bacterium]
ALVTLVADAPGGSIDIVIADNVDYSNGYATPFPSSRIVIYAHPPTDVLELAYSRDWIELVVTHELAHIFHLDVSGGLGRLVRAIFGRVPAPWPVFNALATPVWSIEGLAVGVESAVTGLGRVHGSYHEMVVRTAALEDEIDSIDRLTSASPRWPGGSRVYIYGSLFMDYLARRFGPDASARIVRSTAGAIIPPPLWFGGVGRNALGMSFRDAYRDWSAELTERYTALAAELRVQALTASEAVTSHAGEAAYPRYSPDGAYIAYAAADWRSPGRTRVIDAATGEEVWSRRRNFTGPSSWLEDGMLVTSDLDYVDRFRVFSDLAIIADDAETRITDGARLIEPDVRRDGARIVAVQGDGAANRLVIVDANARVVRTLSGFDRTTLWSMPRFSPRGDRIAASRWRAGVSDIVVMDTLGRVLMETGGGAGMSGSPAWSPDEQWLLFWSDRTGIPNLFAAPLEGGALRQVTNVLTGAFHPDVSPDGAVIVYSGYHHEGFRIERIPFIPSQWRDPMPARGSELTERPAQDVARAAAFEGSLAAAVASADTSTGAPYRYKPVQYMRPYAWVPSVAIDRAGDDYLGVWLYGRDLVDRHAWELGAQVAPGSGRTRGHLTYQFRGLPTIPGLGLHPVPSFIIERDWDRPVRADSAGGSYVDEREDIGTFLLGFTRARIRTSTGCTVGGDVIHRARTLFNAPRRRLCDTDDDLLGVRGSAYYSRYSGAPYSISRENGVALQVGARRRWDREPVTCRISETRELTVDAGYSELTTWNAAYYALPLPGFARHVLAARFSGLYREGPNVSLGQIGGLNTSGLAIPGLASDIAGGGRLLPLRGVEEGERRGNRAWTASAEYRFPLTMVDRSLRPLPVFFDRLSGAGFLDAGHAWCDQATRDATTAAFCPSTSSGDAPIVSAGAELTAWLSAANAAIPVRFGAGWPIQGVSEAKARFYIVGGVSF